MKARKMDWLRLEDRIRAAIVEYVAATRSLDGTVNPWALAAERLAEDVSDAIGDETGRGYPLDIRAAV